MTVRGAFDPGTTTGRDHPETSVIAARRALGRSGNCRRQILYALRFSPMTDEEMQLFLRMSANTQRPRRIELLRAGLLAYTDERRPTLSGSPSIVWEITPLGRLAMTHDTDD